METLLVRGAGRVVKLSRGHRFTPRGRCLDAGIDLRGPLLDASTLRDEGAALARRRLRFRAAG